MRLIPFLTLALASALLAACSADRDDQPEPAAQPAAAEAPAATPSAVGDTSSADTTPGDTDALSNYDCGAGVSVALLEGDKARATIPGQPTVELGKIANSSPPVYTGANLYFEIGDGEAHLSQEDGTEMTCQSG